MKRSLFNVLFFLKKTKLLKNGEASVCMRITVDGTRVENNIRKSIDPSLWSQAKESARGKSRKSCDLNAYIENAKIKLHQIFNELEEEQQPHQRPREPVERKPPAPQHPSRPEAEAHRSQNQHPHSGCNGTTFPSSGGLSPHPVSLRPARFTYALAVGRHPRHAKTIALSERPPAATISTNRATAGHERTVGTPPRRLTFLPSSSLFPQRHQKTSEQKRTFSHHVNT